VEEGSAVPVAFSDVALLDSAGTVAASATADSLGNFFIRGRAGLYRLRARRLGYATATSEPIALRAGEPLVVELRLSAAGIPLEPLVVRARGPERGRDGFARRRALGSGLFLTRDSVALREPRKATDAFRSVRGVFTIESPNSVAIRTMRGYRCLALFVDFHVNAFAMTGEGGLNGSRSLLLNPKGESAAYINRFVDPARIEGIEVYHTFWDIPEELRTASRLGSVWPCGIAIIWTSTVW